MNWEEYQPIPHEEIEQRNFVQYLEWRGLKFTAIPNSTYTKSRRQKQKNREQGLRPGLPDLLIIIPNGKLLFIEMKRTKKGTVSKYQKEWIEELNKLTNIRAEVCKGYDAAKAVVDEELKVCRDL